MAASRFEMWLRTVVRLKPSALAISSVVFPSASKRRTSRWRLVSEIWPLKHLLHVLGDRELGAPAPADASFRDENRLTSTY
jgi:hypothetical protein